MQPSSVRIHIKGVIYSWEVYKMNHPFKVNNAGHLTVGGLDTLMLAEKYGTPLFVYDVERIRQNARAFVNTFKERNIRAQVAYASKAFSSIAMAQVAKQENLSLDVVSQGELYTAIKADFPLERVHMHGNNKSREELKMAVEYQIGCIVIDNFYEMELLNEIVHELNTTIDVLIRLTPGIEAHTHDYIFTGNEDSKFGFDLSNGQATQAIKRLKEMPSLHLKGIHCHIGSQIFETDGFVMAIEKIFSALATWKKEEDFECSVLNLGGGFGIKYTDEDEPLPLENYVNTLIDEVEKQTNHYSLVFPEIWIEPGRSIVGDAAVTLYTVGSMKEIPGVRKYVSVDGGMTDNLRPALYDAKYDAVLAANVLGEKEEEVSIAGKCCESGDMLIWDLALPKVKPDDILAVFSTGAYGYSMSNHYNRFPKAAVVFVENGIDKLVVRRESFEDMIINDLSYN